MVDNGGEWVPTCCFSLSEPLSADLYQSESTHIYMLFVLSTKYLKTIKKWSKGYAVGFESGSFPKICEVSISLFWEVLIFLMYK